MGDTMGFSILKVFVGLLAATSALKITPTSSSPLTTRRVAVASVFSALGAPLAASADNPNIFTILPKEKGGASDIPLSRKKGCKVDKPCSKGAAFPLSDQDAGAKDKYHIKFGK